MLSQALMNRARLLCAHATFIRPAGPMCQYDALMRWATLRNRDAAIARLTKQLKGN